MGQVAGEEGDKPESIRAVLVTVLNVEPGGYEPSSAWSNPSLEGVLTDARTCPVDARTATNAACLVSPASAEEAAASTDGSIDVRTGSPGMGGELVTVSTRPPL